MVTNYWRGMLVVAAALGLALGAAGEAEAQSSSSACSTTWTTACASVSVFSGSSANQIIVSAANTSSDDEADALQSWLQVAVDPDASLKETGTKVWANCKNESEAQSGDFTSCEEISDHWSLSSNNQGSIDWEGESTNEGNSGLVTDMSYCNNSEGNCWEDNVYFEMTFDDAVSFEQWAIQARRLGEDDEYSDWIQVPEPMTTTLVGIGLAAGYAARRRRQDGGDFGDEGEDNGIA